MSVMGPRFDAVEEALIEASNAADEWVTGLDDPHEDVIAIDNRITDVLRSVQRLRRRVEDTREALRS